MIRLHVTDNGTEIAPEDLEYIFDQFTAVPTQYSAASVCICLEQLLNNTATLAVFSEGKGCGPPFLWDSLGNTAPSETAKTGKRKETEVIRLQLSSY